MLSFDMEIYGLSMVVSPSSPERSSELRGKIASKKAFARSSRILELMISSLFRSAYSRKRQYSLV